MSVKDKSTTGGISLLTLKKMPRTARLFASPAETARLISLKFALKWTRCISSGNGWPLIVCSEPANIAKCHTSVCTPPTSAAVFPPVEVNLAEFVIVCQSGTRDVWSQTRAGNEN